MQVSVPEPVPVADVDPAVAAAWCRALLAGDTTAWHAWIDAAHSNAAPTAAPASQAPTGTAPRYLPGAQQLELTRRIGLAAQRAARSVPPGLRARVLRAGLADRSRPDLPLRGLPAPRFGPAPVDPATLGSADLLPIAAGLLAEDLAEGLAEGLVGRAADGAARSLRAPRHVGDPWTVLHLPRRMPRRRLPRGRSRDRTLARAGVLVHATALDTLAVHGWAARAVDGGDQNLAGWLRQRVDAHSLPPALDVVSIAGRAAQEVGVRRTVIVLDPAAAGLAEPPAVRPADIELARRVGRPLGLLVPAAQRRDLLVHGLLPRIAARPASPRSAPIPEPIPEPWGEHLRAHADRMITALRRAGYPVLGSLDRLRPSAAVGAGSPLSAPDVLDEALEIAIALLLDPKDGAR